MGQQYLGEIRLFGGSFAPAGWALCDGQLLAIAEYEALFTLLGTTYGGNGITVFALPDLRGRAPMHQGQGAGLTGRLLAEQVGSETATLSINQMPSHTHPALCSTSGGNQVNPAGQVWARQPSGVTAAYQTAAPDTAMSPAAVGATGAGTGHSNMQPYVAMSFIIAVVGIFPTV